jgi:hypothetical protein
LSVVEAADGVELAKAHRKDHHERAPWSGVSRVKTMIVTSRKRTITAWSAGLSSRLASNHGLHGFFIGPEKPRSGCLMLFDT